MLSFLKQLNKKIWRHRYGAVLWAFLGAAAVTGIGCVFFAGAFDEVLSRQLDVRLLGAWTYLTTPLLILISVELVRRWGPYADGAGVPQAIFAISHMDADNEKRLLPLVSLRTMAVKAASLLLAVWAGASTGREGPTVHVAACLFVACLMLVRRWTGISFDMRSAVIAGGAAGLAAAFNTPLAGVTFAIEELVEDNFAPIKEYVLTGIIVAALAAKWMTGEYGYFGKFPEPLPVPWHTAAVVGGAAGALGILFSELLMHGRRLLALFRGRNAAWLRPVLLGALLVAVAAATGPHVMGPGNMAAQQILQGGQSPDTAFPFAKLLATLLTYWSGVAGGVFAPCLSIGATLGAQLAGWLHQPVAACALIGMVAFLTGTIQAPMTAFVIIFEMTGDHQMLLPLMLAALTSFMLAKVLGARKLYHVLSENYRGLLASKPA